MVPTYMCAGEATERASHELIKAGPTMVLWLLHMCAAAYSVCQSFFHIAQASYLTKRVNHPFSLSRKNENPLTSCPYFCDAPQMPQYLHKNIKHCANSQKQMSSQVSTIGEIRILIFYRYSVATKSRPPNGSCKQKIIRNNKVENLKHEVSKNSS
jgi:hypothetical protein